MVVLDSRIVRNCIERGMHYRMAMLDAKIVGVCMERAARIGILDFTFCDLRSQNCYS